MTTKEYSVIINVRNGEKFLERAISQILSQSQLPHKIIIYNNFSSDHTYQIANKYIDRYKNLFILQTSTEYLSLYRARNYALQLVRTPFFCFLDVDDLWIENKCKQQLDLFGTNENAIACITNYSIIFEKSFNIFSSTIRDINVTQLIDENFYKFVFNYNIHFSSVMFNTIPFKKLLGNSPFNSKLTILGDFEIFLALFQKNKIIILNSNASKYVHHSNNTGYKEYYRLTFESLYIAVKFFKRFDILKALYILFIFNYKYFIHIIAKLKSYIK